MSLLYRQHGKRLLDLLLASVLLVVATPLLVTVAGLVRWRLGSPILFTQLRPGHHGRLFRLYKFRTMNAARDSAGRLLADAERLTPFGRWLRSTSLDELPELWNVLRSEMSLVGPRPLHVEYLALYTPEEARRHDVLPGITGLAQISGRNRLPWASRLALDRDYADRCSLWLDLTILLKTIRTFVVRHDVTAEGYATGPTFRGMSVDCEAAQASLLPAAVVDAVKNCYKPRPTTASRQQEIQTMDNCQFLRTLDEAFQRPAGATQMDEALQDIAEYSSLTVLVLIAAIDEKYGVTMPPEVLMACRSVADLAGAVHDESMLLSKSA